MKTLFNSSGISLVVLLIAMTLIAALGASFVSLVSMKQRGFLYQSDSYRALNMANAGTEYAIRYISDNLRDTTSTSQYFQNPGIFQTSTSPVTVPISTRESFSYYYNYATDTLVVRGVCVNSTRQVDLANFRRYMDSFTLQYDPASSSRSPYYSSGSGTSYINIPFINNNNLSVTILGMSLVMPSWSPSSSTRYLQRIYIGGTQLYNYSTDYTQFSVCPQFGSGFMPCRDTNGWWGSDMGIRITTGTTVFTFNTNIPYTLAGNSTSICQINFDSNSFTGKTYTVILRYRITGETTDRTSTLTFTI